MISIVLASVLALTPPAPVVTHDNQRPAGTLQDGTLVLHLRAATGVWQPEGPQGPGLEIDAFGEGTGPLMAPAPLIRVPEGTSIVATIKNQLATTLTVHGLCEHTGDPATAACAPIAIPAHNERSVGFRAGRVGTVVQRLVVARSGRGWQDRAARRVRRVGRGCRREGREP